MTNAEVAAHFATLPSEEIAEIAFLNLDSGTFEIELIDPVTDELLDKLDDQSQPTRRMLKRKLCVWQEW